MDANRQPVSPTFRHLPVCFGCGAENPVALGVTNSATLVCRAHVHTTSERRFSVVATIATVDDPDVVLVEGEATFVLARAEARAPEPRD